MSVPVAADPEEGELPLRGDDALPPLAIVEELVILKADLHPILEPF